jgi:DNA-binding transcriptional regulator LsrR (DeoR family)
VEIRIHHPLRRSSELEFALTHRYDLRRCYVINGGNLSDLQTLRLLGRQAALYLGEHLREESILGISWGTAVHEVAEAIRPKQHPRFMVVQMIGSIGSGDPIIDGPEVARTIAAAYGGRYVTLNSPVIVQDRSTRDAIMGEQKIQEVLELARRADILLVGIGSTEPYRSGMVRAGVMTSEEMSALKAKGAVGDVGCGFFDIKGNYDGFAINDRVVGMSLEQINNGAGMVVGVAGGKIKAQAILGALRGGFVDVLVTDDKATEEILVLDPI